jgi:Na+-driven multidrug efflux pump
MLKRLFSYYLAGEIRPMLALAIPLVLAELGWMTMGIVDTMMVGRQSQSEPSAWEASPITSWQFSARG